MKQQVWSLEGLDCANCAAKIEKAVSATGGVKNVNVNFIQKRLSFSTDREDTFNEIETIIHKLEPNVKIMKNTDSMGKRPLNITLPLIRIFASALFLILANVLPVSPAIQNSLYIASYVLIGLDILWRAGHNMIKGAVFDENFLMAIATIGAFAIGQYSEAVAVMLFYQVGELFQHVAVHRSRKSITDLMDIRPDYANVIRDNIVEKCNPNEVSIGEMILIKPGEKIPLDAKIIEGTSSVDTSALTGESVPRTVHMGDTVMNGCINVNSVITAKVIKVYSESTVSKILDLVENATEKKAKSENFITRFARYYTPAVVLSALAIALLPPLILPGNEFSTWLYRALVFLVISCPCALVISVPLSFFSGIGSASRAGILIKGSNYLETLSKVKTVVFDKTGTLTKGVFKVTEIYPNHLSKSQLLKLSAYAESMSTHPIAASIRAAYGADIDPKSIHSIEEIAGHGICAQIEGQEILIGNAKLMQQYNISIHAPYDFGTQVFVALDRKYAGCLVISDEIKLDSEAAIQELKRCGIEKTVMLTGDTLEVAQQIGDTLHIDEVYAGLLPDGKVQRVEEILPLGNLAFVGDGVNDAPVLARADIGIAMGGLGSDAAIEAADVVIMTDEPSKLATALKISRKTLRIVKQNIIFSLIIKFLFLVLGAFGLASMWEAVFADVGISILAILNAIRAFRLPKNP